MKNAKKNAWKIYTEADTGYFVVKGTLDRLYLFFQCQLAWAHPENVLNMQLSNFIHIITLKIFISMESKTTTHIVMFLFQEEMPTEPFEN